MDLQIQMLMKIQDTGNLIDQMKKLNLIAILINK
jgi:hypothetical protein